MRLTTNGWTIKIPYMTRYKALDTVLVPFPFTDLSTQKKRPALILATIPFNSHHELYVCAMITSQTSGDGLKGDVTLNDWEAAGLLLESRARLAKIVTLEDGLILKRLGAVSKHDRTAIKKSFKQIFSHLSE